MHVCKNNNQSFSVCTLHVFSSCSSLFLLVVHLAGCLKVRVNRVLIVERGRSGAFLIIFAECWPALLLRKVLFGVTGNVRYLVHVGPSNKLSTKEEVLSVKRVVERKDKNRQTCQTAPGQE